MSLQQRIDDLEKSYKMISDQIMLVEKEEHINPKTLAYLYACRVQYHNELIQLKYEQLLNYL